MQPKSLRYSNLDGSRNPHGIGDVLRWQLQRKRPSAQGKHAPALTAEAVRAGLAAVPERATSVTWIGHASFLVRVAGAALLIDPVLSDRLVTVPRLVPPGLSWGDLPRIDAVLITHNHRDHLDVPTVRRLAEAGTRFVVPQGLGDWFAGAVSRDVTELGWWETHDVGDARVTFAPSQHWSMRSAFDRDRSWWGGYVVEGSGGRVYHSGDTAYFEGFREIGARVGKIDLAMLPIGAYAPRWFMKAQHMDPFDAAHAFADLGADRMVAMHWGTFILTDEPVDEPPELAVRAFAERGLDRARLLLPKIGETIAV